MRITSLLLVCLVLATARASHNAAAAVGHADIEEALCGQLREPFMFWMWRRLAGSPDPKRLAQLTNVEPIRFTARDGIELGGYKLAAKHARGYLLVAQGNATLADQLVGALEPFRDSGLDVYVFDYRGYGISQGKSRLGAITGDYGEITSHLNRAGYDIRLLYGISMGGVILLNASGRAVEYDRMVVDSSPARISDLGCPRSYDPVEHLPPDGSRVMIISGGRDTVVTPAQMDELVRAAAARGARVMQDPEFAHPHQDAPDTQRRRQEAVLAFLRPLS